MPELYPSPFAVPASVDAWDAWFRWRGPGGLHDVSIEDTWFRVATFLTREEPSAATDECRALLLDALATWQLLPDERLLADAGTGRPIRITGALDAVLNAAAFVRTDADPPSLALDLLTERTSLAAGCLQRAMIRVGVTRPQIHIGLIGIAEALTLLGMAYDSDAGREQAGAMARAVAYGIRLATSPQSGPFGKPAGQARPGTRKRPPVKSAIMRKPRLALLANDTSDAADPSWKHHRMDVSGGAIYHRCAAMRAGTAIPSLRVASRRTERPETLAEISPRSQLALRAALQPWIDSPIDYPLLVLTEPEPIERQEIELYAASCGLPTPVRFTQATKT